MSKLKINQKDWEEDPIKVLDEIIAAGVSNMNEEQFDIIMQCYYADAEYFHDKLRGIVNRIIQDQINGKS